MRAAPLALLFVHTQPLLKLLPAAEIPSIKRVQASHSERLLNLRKAVALQLQPKQLAAALAQCCQGGLQPLYALPPRGLLERIWIRPGQRQIVYRNLRILASAVGLAAHRPDLE